MRSLYLMFININLCLTFSKWLNISKMYPVLDISPKTSRPSPMQCNRCLILNFLPSTNPNRKVILIGLKVKNRRAREEELLAKREINKKPEKIERTTKRMTTITTTMAEGDFSNQFSKTSQVSLRVTEGHRLRHQSLTDQLII